MPIVYGPVPSWRLGRSLGIDPIPPPKTCVYDCIYCQLGPTVIKEADPKRVKPGVTPSMIRRELSEYIEKRGLGGIDYVTFSGSGEPTLNPSFEEMVRVVKELVSVPVALLTSAGTICYGSVKEGMKRLDVVVAKLDAPDESSFRIVNRPHPSVNLDEVVEGLKRLRKEFRGILAAEIMLLKAKRLGMDSTREGYLLSIAELVREIGFDEVHLETVIRPPAMSVVERVNEEELLKAKELFREIFPRHVTILSPMHPRPLKQFELKGAKELKVAILSFLVRRPSRARGIGRGLGVPLGMVENALKELEAEGKVIRYEYMGEEFYKPKLE